MTIGAHFPANAYEFSKFSDDPKKQCVNLKSVTRSWCKLHRQITYLYRIYKMNSLTASQRNADVYIFKTFHMKIHCTFSASRFWLCRPDFHTVIGSIIIEWFFFSFVFDFFWFVVSLSFLLSFAFRFIYSWLRLRSSSLWSTRMTNRMNNIIICHWRKTYFQHNFSHRSFKMFIMNHETHFSRRIQPYKSSTFPLIPFDIGSLRAYPVNPCRLLNNIPF